jgi:hypothetical protein
VDKKILVVLAEAEAVRTIFRQPDLGVFQWTGWV